MKLLLTKLTLCSLLAAPFVLGPGTAFATPFGTEITIYDGKHSGTDWWGAHEDQETEPGMIGSQDWDLEGFFLNGSSLSLVGGYNFKDGLSGFNSGDIFIDIDGKYGMSEAPADFVAARGNFDVATSFGYEFALDLSDTVGDFSYNLVDLRSDSAMTTTAYYEQNEDSFPSSDPWRYKSGGTILESGTYLFESGLTDAQVGFIGGSHYAISGLDLSFLAGIDVEEFVVHFTMGCGNDNLMGTASAPVPEPCTMLLFGTGLVSFASIRKKLVTKNA